ncbi:hypothetical protein HQ560_08935, partial [bacterium]|nr:hypothetical protein [bacterium]
GSHYAYTEGQSDAQRERHFRPGTGLSLLEMDGLYGKVKSLIDDPKGVIRDPDVSFDGARILFAWKKDDRKDDYHLFEMEAKSGSIRQLTRGLGFADYEGVYLPNGDIVFNSSRCVQTVDCWWTEVSNLYTCGPDGEHLRRLSFDQVHTNYPTVTPDGRVIYTRWDYNDRGQLYPQGLFQMFPDGTGQTEVYGNNSWFPTTILHARAIPGTQKYLSVFSGHHTRQKGWLGVIDPGMGRQEAAGAQLIAPVRETKAVRVDRYGQAGDQWQYPYPLSETEFLVTFKPEKGPRFAIYWMNAAGDRELLASDPKTSCSQPIPLAPRPVPHRRPTLSDYRQADATLYMQDIYHGPGLAGVPRGTIKALRAVAIEYRAAGVGSNGNRGPAGGALVSTPISINGTWDVKRILGTAKVHDDGSACFTVPARTPMYFQALDAKGHAVQTMRSWVTLQPGENIACVGCHEHKNTTPPNLPTSQALFGGPQPLAPPPGGVEGFSFIRQVQPILDKHCVRCHTLDERPKYAPAPKRRIDPKKTRPVAIDAPWHYITKDPGKDWTKPDAADLDWDEGNGSLAVGAVPGAKNITPWQTRDVWLHRTLDLETIPKGVALRCQHDGDLEVYVNGVLALKRGARMRRPEAFELALPAVRALKPGKNTLAVHCRSPRDSRFVDVALVDAGNQVKYVLEKPKPPTPPPGVKYAFSLKGTQTLDGGSQRKWSDSYKALAHRNVTNWIHVQSAPSMLPPYHAGAAKSKLIEILEAGHGKVKLSDTELRTIAAWIDLLVPYSGSYTEAMDEKGIVRYNHFLAKRTAEAQQEAKNIQDFLTTHPTRD